MSILITGGFGYIGSHIVRILQQDSQAVHVVDISDELPQLGSVPHLNIDISQVDSILELNDYLNKNSIRSIIHLAARKQVAESVSQPLWYYKQNLVGLLNLLEAVNNSPVENFVFSSTAAVYGVPGDGVAEENSSPAPINPYGESKIAGEFLLRSFAKATGLRQLSLRYFNVAGAGWSDLADVQALNLIPIVFKNISKRESPVIFGNDYDTIDGTCVRDYVHVLDLARAHIAALDYLENSEKKFDVFNVGTGVGSSVLQVIKKISEVSGLDIEPIIEDRRKGDPGLLIASVQRIKDYLDWHPQHSLDEIISSAWEGYLNRVNPEL